MTGRSPLLNTDYPLGFEAGEIWQTAGQLRRRSEMLGHDAKWRARRLQPASDRHRAVSEKIVFEEIDTFSEARNRKAGD